MQIKAFKCRGIEIALVTEEQMQIKFKCCQNSRQKYIQANSISSWLDSLNIKQFLYFCGVAITRNEKYNCKTKVSPRQACYRWCSCWTLGENHLYTLDCRNTPSFQAFSWSDSCPWDVLWSCSNPTKPQDIQSTRIAKVWTENWNCDFSAY